MYFPADLVNKRTGENWKYNKDTDKIIKTETVAGKMQPAANGSQSKILNNNGTEDGNKFSARPLKHWRKQRTQVYQDHGFTKSKTLEGTFEIPGATNVVSLEEGEKCSPCVNQQRVPSVNVTYMPKKNDGKNYPQIFADYSDYVNKCPATVINKDIEKCVSLCDPEKKARARVRYPSALNTNASKPKYYTSNASYLRGRCKTFKQNQYQYGGQNNTKCGNLAEPSAFRTNCTGCSNCDNGKSACNQKISYYKPNNCKFAVQGGVSSGLRVSRLKYDTINTFANGFVNKPNYGPAVANAYAYSSRTEAPFTVKNKEFNCSQNAGSFRRTGARNIKC